MDANTGLVSDYNRWYDPATGKWLSDDPAGFTAGDANLLRYIGNDPTNGTDRTGLEGGPIVTVMGYLTAYRYNTAKGGTAVYGTVTAPNGMTWSNIPLDGTEPGPAISQFQPMKYTVPKWNYPLWHKFQQWNQQRPHLLGPNGILHQSNPPWLQLPPGLFNRPPAGGSGGPAQLGPLTPEPVYPHGPGWGPIPFTPGPFPIGVGVPTYQVPGTPNWNDQEPVHP